MAVQVLLRVLKRIEEISGRSTKESADIETLCMGTDLAPDRYERARALTSYGSSAPVVWARYTG